MDQLVVDVRSIGEQNISQDALVLVRAGCLKSDLLSENEADTACFGPLAVGLAFLGAVDAVESEALRAFVVQDLDRIAVENFGDDAGEVSDNSSANEP